MIIKNYAIILKAAGAIVREIPKPLRIATASFRNFYVIGQPLSKSFKHEHEGAAG
jgi:hypothetical protein